MARPPLTERIKALEDANAQLIAKIDRLKVQVKHNHEAIRKMKKREEKQDIDALMQRRTEQSQRDKQRNRESKAAMYREEMERRIEDCLRMNGKIP